MIAGRSLGLIAGALALGGCASIQETPFAPNMVRLDVKPYAEPSVGEATLRRAAELTLQNGYSAFRLMPIYVEFIRRVRGNSRHAPRWRPGRIRRLQRRGNSQEIGRLASEIRSRRQDEEGAVSKPSIDEMRNHVLDVRARQPCGIQQSGRRPR